MTYKEVLDKAVYSMSDEEMHKFIQGIANDDVVLVVKMLFYGVVKLPKEDAIEFIDSLIDSEDIIDEIESQVHIPDSLREEAKKKLEEFDPETERILIFNEY